MQHILSRLDGATLESFRYRDGYVAVIWRRSWVTNIGWLGPEAPA